MKATAIIQWGNEFHSEYGPLGSCNADTIAWFHSMLSPATMPSLSQCCYIGKTTDETEKTTVNITQMTAQTSPSFTQVTSRNESSVQSMLDLSLFSS